MLTTYTTDGSQTVFTFDWPYLDRTHVFVTVNEAPRPFAWVDDHTLKITTMFGEPFDSGLTLKIFRATPDVVSFAEFKDNSNLTAEDLNRARLQVLFLIQERSGGIAGYVGQAIQSVTNDLQSISGALSDLEYIRGVLEAGLQTLDELQASITRIDNGAKSLQDQIDAEITERVALGATLTQRVDDLSSDVDGRLTSFKSQVQLLQSSTDILANKQDVLEAKVDSIDLTPDDHSDDDDSLIAASIINTAVTGVKMDFAQKQQIEAYAHDISTLEATVDQNWIDAEALVQTERTARVEADLNVAGQISAITEQITTLQSTVDDNIAQVVQDMQTKVDTINGKVTNLNAQYTLKVQVQRTDGRPVVAGIGLAATSNNNVTNSEIILTANRLLFVDPAAPDGVVKPIFESGLVDGANTFVIPANVLGDKKYPGRLLVDGAIDTRTLAANSVTADKIVAGQITTDKLQVGNGLNQCLYSEMYEAGGDYGGPRGWHYAAVGGRDLNSAFSTAVARLGNPGYNLTNGGTSYMFSTWTNGGTDVSQFYEFTYSELIPILASTWYEVSAYIQNHRCESDIGVFWYDYNQAQVSSTGFKANASFWATYSQFAQGGGQALALYGRLGGKVLAPANATYARVVIRKGFHSAADANSFLFWTRPMLAQTYSNTSVLAPYQPNGLGTFITPQGISTPSLSALSATIGLLRTAGSGARMELESNQLRVYDGNNVLRVRLGIW